MSVRVGINGFGRIGRHVFRAADATGGGPRGRRDQRPHRRRRPSRTCSSTTRCTARFEATVEAAGRRHRRRRQGDHGPRRDGPGELPWKELGVDIVLECTGLFTDAREGRRATSTPAPRRSSSRAPAKGEDVTVVLGVNDDSYDPAKHHVISNASCTTNCLAPVAKVLHDNFGIEQGLMTTVPRVHQRPAHPRPARTRTCAARAPRRCHMIPSTTGAAKALGEVHPRAQGQARRHRRARAHAERLASSTSPPSSRSDDQPRSDQRRASRPPPNGAAEGHPRLHRGAARLERLHRRPALVASSTRR